MNKQATASIKSICDALPFNDNLIYMAAFGSQVRGTERPDSDLDIFYIVKEWSFGFDLMVKRVGRGTSNCIQDINTFSYDIVDVKQHANLYGSPIHDVLRGIGGVQTLYQTESFDDLIKEPDLMWCAKEWLDIAAMYLSPPDNSRGPTCFHMSLVIDYSLRAYLLYNGIKFPRTRDVEVLYNIRPLGGVEFDFDVINHWRDYIIHMDNPYTESDMVVATRTARQTYQTVKSILKN